jgi:succinyl-CoA synthetase beta subunit/citryl-CoA synthetase large subunit
LLRSPVLVASRSGGTGVEAAQTVREPFSATTGCAAHVARRLGRRLELGGRVLLAFSDVARRLADLFLAADATLLEINPLLIVGDGVVAVDAHLAVDGEALARQPQPDAAASAGLGEDATELERAAAEIDASDHRGVAGRVVEFGGPVGLLIGGGGASLTVFDAVLRRGLEPFNYCEIGGNPTAEKIARLTALLLSHSRVEQLAVVMNVVNNTRADLIAEGVIAGTLEAGRNPATTIAAFRVPGHDETRCRDLLAAHGVEYLDQTVSLEGAIDRVADARQAVAS